ncbi:MAG: hypothetical protein JOZ52_01170 [Acidobacteria bacterium]|nr:hypothetical protein [Acidobacteriota bacterium]
MRLRVRPKVNDKEKGLSRKRFYLIKGSLAENKELLEKIARQTIQTRECYYRDIKASEAFINWLKEGDCESVYCRSIEEKYLTGATAVPEFVAAYERGAKEYKTPELGRLWLTTNLTDELRDGFYRRKQDLLQSLINEVETATKAPVISVMTDRNGTAYFTDLTPGTYTVTNLLPTEFGDKTIFWTKCEVKVKAGLEIPYLMSNSSYKNVKCVGEEKPLSACDASPQTALKR